MKYSAQLVIVQAVEYFENFVERIACMNDDWEIEFLCPFNLNLKTNKIILMVTIKDVNLSQKMESET